MLIFHFCQTLFFMFLLQFKSFLSEVLGIYVISLSLILYHLVFHIFDEIVKLVHNLWFGYFSFTHQVQQIYQINKITQNQRDQQYSLKKIKSKYLLAILARFIVMKAFQNFTVLQSNQMLQLQRKKGYRISENRKRLSQGEAKGVLMHIDAPVYQQYNKIELGATQKSHRIYRKSLSSSTSAGPQYYTSCKLKWENLVDRYIESKQKIQLKKGLIDSSFQFLKLDKANRFRYIRLTQNEALPLDLSRIRKMTEQIAVEKQKVFQRHKTDYEASMYEQQEIIRRTSESYHKKGVGPKNVKQKVLNYFIQNYFKNKQKQPFREKNITKHTNPQRNHCFTKSLMRNNTN